MQNTVDDMDDGVWTGDQVASPADTAPLAENEPAQIAPVSLPDELFQVQSMISALDEAQLLELLTHVPAHQLARALERLLAPHLERAGEAAAVVDKRQSERSKTFRVGKIVYNHNMSVTNCRISDFSVQGCRVKVDSVIGIPNHFSLHVVNSDVKYECEVVWHTSGELGLRFIG